PPVWAAPPERPREVVDTSDVRSTGRTIAVPARGNFQAALNAAQPGDVITLEAGATFRGPFTLPEKTGTGWIIVRTSAPDSSLPHSGTRVTPAHATVAPNGKSLAVIDSYLADFKEVGADSQAVLGVNGPGPFKIVNNHLESAGENVMFGGGDPAIHDLVPSDIEIRHNYFFKPLSWRKGDPSYAGTQWSIKNLFELKNARRVLVEGNILENIWLADQAGFALQLTVRNQYGRAPWSTIE